MSLHLVKMRPDRVALTRWGHRAGVILRGGDPGYALHAALAGAFGDRAPRPFRLVEKPGDTVLYGYAGETAASLVGYAQAVADPELMAILGIDDALSKEMPANWRTGDRFGFEVRVRPVVRQDKPGDPKHARERDAFQAAAEATDTRPAEGRTPAEMAGLTRQGVYADWLAARFGDACRVADPPGARLATFHRTRVARRDAKRDLCESEGPDAVFDGVLDVADPAAFATLLARGVGRHCAFGFGMLLLRPPR